MRTFSAFPGVCGLWAALASTTVTIYGCGSEPHGPPPIFAPKATGGAGGERNAEGGDTSQGGQRPSGCRSKVEGCLCDEIGGKTACKVYETFGDYVTCTTGDLTCGEDKKWGPCIGERTTTPLSSSKNHTFEPSLRESQDP